MKYLRFKTASNVVAILWLVVIIAFIYGYFANIFTIVKLMSAPFGVEIVLRCVGLFMVPLGSILGYF